MFSLKMYLPRLMCQCLSISYKSWSKAGPIASTQKSSRERVKQVKVGGISQTVQKASSTSKANPNNIMNDDPRVQDSHRRFRNELVQFKSDLQWRLNVDQYQKQKGSKEMNKEKPKNETKSKACLKSSVASQPTICRRKEPTTKTVKNAESEVGKITSDGSRPIFKKKTIEEYDHERHNAFVAQKPAASAIALLLSAGAANATEFLPRGAYGARRHLDCQAYGLPRFNIDGDLDTEVD